MLKKTIFLTFAAAALLAQPAIASADADGEKTFKKRCSSCHETQAGKHKTGPSLAGVFGRKAGTVEGFKSYKALVGSDVVWDEASLDGWLANPKKFIGKTSTMTFKLKKEEERKAIIEYLKGL
ncbi:MAG: c-type cytochrome [Rhodospirillaceae bacterium]|nr:c-type cytochrome [Rhodospirillaceae bacterium]